MTKKLYWHQEGDLPFEPTDEKIEILCTLILTRLVLDAGGALTIPSGFHTPEEVDQLLAYEIAICGTGDGGFRLEAQLK